MTIDDCEVGSLVLDGAEFLSKTLRAIESELSYASARSNSAGRSKVSRSSDVRVANRR